jgi:hypothetical protein
MDDHVGKPIDFDELLDKLKYFFFERSAASP